MPYLNFDLARILEKIILRRNLVLFALGLKTFQKRVILIVVDFFILVISLSYSFGNKSFPFLLNISNPFNFKIWMFIFLTITFYICTNHYKSLSKYAGTKSFYLLCFRNTLVTLFLYIYGLIFTNYPFYSKEFLLFFFVINFLMAGFRLFIRDMLLKIDKKNNKFTTIAIYGAGKFGAQLEASLRISGGHFIFTFIDDKKQLLNRSINGIPINSIDFLKKNSSKIEKVFLAMPSISIRRRKSIAKELHSFGLEVLQIPSIHDISSGKARIENVRPIKIHDLLYRESVKPNETLLQKCITSKVVCITGAGGSIGSELCREIGELNPSKLILIELSELNLYNISKEFENKEKYKFEVKLMLGDACSDVFISNVFEKENIDIIFHASAFKHVPIVELNPVQGILNNVISTWNICQNALDNNVSKVVLVSTDKAVRPSNVMGASKRLSEIIVQAYANKINMKSNIKSENKTCFYMVRFGNVLGSSGSVVPLFKKQINTGGPVTITHKDIERYFMSITEAAQLLIQTISLSKGGEVFLLDMGSPIKIKDLAERMIINSGLSIRSKDNPEGDIEIIFTGLRPGEKLHEELLIDAESKPTINPLIFVAKDKFTKNEKLFRKLDDLKKHINLQDKNSVIKILSELVPEWKKSPELN